jgi:hypothetical protein
LSAQPDSCLMLRFVRPLARLQSAERSANGYAMLIL